MTQGHDLIAGRGVGPFVTLRHLPSPGGHMIWLARNHRKGLGATLAPRRFWQAPLFNILMATGFAVGAILFISGAAMSLDPALATAAGLSVRGVNTVFFAGSVFFTLSAYLQLFQSANAGQVAISSAPPQVRSLIGWRPKEPGWLSSFAQFLGTLLFNANTYFAIQGGSWLRQDLTIWAPDFFGSVLFLLSGYLALVETCHDWWDWQPRNLAWWIVVVNFLGCIAFMISAALAFVPPSGAATGLVATSTAFTLIGAVGFFAGALLTVAESLQQRPEA